MSEYGPLAFLVTLVGAILAASFAIQKAWTRGANWLPPEEEVPTAISPVVGVISSVAIVLLWIERGRRLSGSNLEMIALGLAIALLVLLLLYVALMNIYIFRRPGPIGAADVRMIGGLWLTEGGGKALKRAGTVQKAFMGAAYDADLIWPRPARALAKVVFIFVYVMLQFSGSVALSAIALSIAAAGAIPHR